MPGQMFQSTLFSVIFISLFLRFTFFMIVEYNTTLSYENVNKSTPYLFRVICVSAGFGRCHDCARSKRNTNYMHWE